jgi:hypothetical protein
MVATLFGWVPAPIDSVGAESLEAAHLAPFGTADSSKVSSQAQRLCLSLITMKR